MSILRYVRSTYEGRACVVLAPPASSIANMPSPVDTYLRDWDEGRVSRLHIPSCSSRNKRSYYYDLLTHTPCAGELWELSIRVILGTSSTSCCCLEFFFFFLLLLLLLSSILWAPSVLALAQACWSNRTWLLHCVVARVSRALKTRSRFDAGSSGISLHLPKVCSFVHPFTSGAVGFFAFVIQRLKSPSIS